MHDRGVRSRRCETAEIPGPTSNREWTPIDANHNNQTLRSHKKAQKPQKEIILRLMRFFAAKRSDSIP
jgi:hypothetical protein